MNWHASALGPILRTAARLPRPWRTASSTWGYSSASKLGICAISQQHKADAKRQTFAVKIDPPSLTLTGDATAITEVLKRLLDSAIKFTPEGGQVGVAAQTGRTPDTVDLVVWDNSIGIAEGQMDHILKPFAQADGRLSRSHEGIGMGLAYVDQMVCLMGETIALESTPGEGSRFTITLPVQSPIQ